MLLVTLFGPGLEEILFFPMRLVQILLDFFSHSINDDRLDDGSDLCCLWGQKAAGYSWAGLLGVLRALAEAHSAFPPFSVSTSLSFFKQEALNHLHDCSLFSRSHANNLRIRQDGVHQFGSNKRTPCPRCCLSPAFCHDSEGTDTSGPMLPQSSTNCAGCTSLYHSWKSP